MKISLNWLKQYVDVDLSPEVLAEKITLAGLEVEEIEHIGSTFSGVVVGRVEKTEKHPNADKLTVCTVNDGEALLQIVCGAPNVAQGQLVPLAKVGAKLDGDFTIKPVKLRGLKSFGMLCSERELGLSGSHEGIMVLDGNQYEPGQVYQTSDIESDTVFEVAITPNRPDCLCHFGVAREIAAILNQPLKRPELQVVEGIEPIDTLVDIDIQDVEACPRYSARVIQNVVIGPSPKWLKTRLEAIGLRSINNVVDITNFVLMETGHPLHAFDYNEISGHKIIVRKANPGETFVTLDEQERKLHPDDLLICDGSRAVGLAGVMGGQNSEVSEHTTNILLESAYFDPMTIRRTAKRLGLSTDASQRFERGADPNGTLFALDRATQLIADLAQGQVAMGVIDANVRPIAPAVVDVRPERVNQILGSDFSVEIMTDVFTRLGIEARGDKPIRTVIPTFRPDLTREIDLIEEVVRLLGFDHIDAAQLTAMPLMDNRNPQADFIESLRDHMVGQGFAECVHSSMVARWQAQWSEDIQPVAIMNPLSPETAVLRTWVMPTLLNAVAWNQNRSTSNLKLFEIGKQFRKTAQGYVEYLSLAVALSGVDYRGSYWTDPKKAWSFLDIKGVLGRLFDRYHRQMKLLPQAHLFLAPESATEVQLDGLCMGYLGEIDQEILSKWDINQPVWGFEILIGPLAEASQARVAFRPIAKYPAVKRDLAFVLDESVAIGDVISKMEEVGGEYCTEVSLFDLYRGDQIDSNKKSAAFALTFLSMDRTLTDTEIDPLMTNIIKAVNKHFQAELRS